MKQSLITKRMLKKVLGMSLIVTLILVATGIYIEPNLVDAASTNDQVIVTLQVDAGISITSPPDSTMSTNLGVINNTAIGTTTWNIKTNSAGGYTLALNASTNPAMKSGANSVGNFATTTAFADLWSTVPNGTAAFGFGVFSTSTNAGVLAAFNSGAVTSCGATSTPSTTLKYAPVTTYGDQVVNRTSTTTTTGNDINVCYAAEQKGFYIPSGTYTASITATAVTQ